MLYQAASRGRPSLKRAAGTIAGCPPTARKLTSPIRISFNAFALLVHPRAIDHVSHRSQTLTWLPPPPSRGPVEPSHSAADIFNQKPATGQQGSFTKVGTPK